MPLQNSYSEILFLKGGDFPLLINLKPNYIEKNPQKFVFLNVEILI